MRLRWTVVHATADPPRTQELVVRCPRGTALRAVLDLVPLPAAAGKGPGGQHVGGQGTWVRAGGTLLEPDATVGRPPLLDGAVLTVGSGAAAPTPTVTPHLLELVVTAGPDAGRVVPVRRGRLTVGRAAGSDVRLDDPRLSRSHCTLTVSVDGVRMTDTRSTNGTAAFRGDAPHEARDGPTLLGLGQPWRAGAGRMLLRTVVREHAPPVAVTDRDDGTRELRRSPRARLPEVAPALRLPAPARAGRSGRFPLLAVVLPAVAATGLAWWTGSAVYLFLAALGPLLVAGSWWTARRDARHDGTLGRRAHARAVAQVRTEARAAAADLARARARALPDAATLLEHCLEVQGQVWERHHTDDDALRVRLGHARDPGEGPGGSRPGLVERVAVVDHEDLSKAISTPDDLLTVDLRHGAVGVVEPTSDPSCARFLVGQLVGLLPPTSLAVVPVLTDARSEPWRWVSLLPHLLTPPPAGPEAPSTPGAVLDGVLRLVSARAARQTDPRTGASPTPGAHGGPAVLVLVDDPDGQVDSGDLQRLASAHLLGVHLIVVSRTVAALPRICTSVVTPDGHDGVDGVLTRVADGAAGHAVLDRVGPWWSTRLARALAPLRMASTDPAGALPPQVALADLVDLTPHAIRRRWLRPSDGLAVPLGSGPRGPVVVDLTTAGPHALVAGTTGAGKSDLLRSWLLAMAASQPPDRLALLLVDYKGGSTFDDLAGLPHCVGLLTDLDGGATTRVLHSLRAEVRRRERLIAEAGARDLLSYRAVAGPGATPVPRLLVVVDEFRVLAEDAPDVLGQFVRVAATGRSLGIHLVLATQRPGGVVSTDIRANTGLRIALRVQDPAESRDVVDRPDAAWLPPSAPGRAVVVGAGVDVVLQTAWTGGADDGPAVSVTQLTGWSASDEARPVAGPPGSGPRGTSHAPAAGEPSPTPHRPATSERSAPAATPGGAATVVAAVLEAARQVGADTARSPWLPPLPAVVSDPAELLGSPGHRPGPEGLLLGVADLPWSQSRRPLVWRPVLDGPLLVLGAGRSGRSGTLAVATRAGAAAGIPVVVLRAGVGEEDHVVDTLSALLRAPNDDDPGRCRVVVVVDDVDELLDPAADPAAADLLLRLVRAGHRDGVGVVLAGGRALAASRLASSVRTRLVHRTVDRSDAMLAGVPSGTSPLPPFPGRCHAVGFDHLGSAAPPAGPAAAVTPGEDCHAVEVQVLAPDAGGAPPARSDPPPWLPLPLPVRLEVSELPAPTRATIPLGQTSGGTAWLLDVHRGGLVVVAGPAGSGRSTALRTGESQASAAGLRVGTSGRSAVGLGGEVLDLLLLDDVDRCSEADLEHLEQWLTSRSGPLVAGLSDTATVVVSGPTAWFADGFRGLPALARQGGHGVVLWPGRSDVRDVLGVRGGPTQQARVPGRGLLVERGLVHRVQVARGPAGDGPRATARSTLARPIPSHFTTTRGPTP